MKITKARAKAITNQADQEVTHIEITDINEGDQAIFTNLYVDDNLLTTGRIYSFDTFPCESLNHGEKELIKGNEPDDKWNIKEIKLWFDSKQKKMKNSRLKNQTLIIMSLTQQRRSY